MYYVKVFMNNLHRWETYSDLSLSEAQNMLEHHRKLKRFCFIKKYKNG